MVLHIFEVIKSTKFLPENLVGVIDSVIERNSFSHPVNLLISMIVDERKHIREFDFRKITKSNKVSLQNRVKRMFSTSKN